MSIRALTAALQGLQLKKVQISKVNFFTSKPAFKAALRHFLVDIVPTLFLLIAMAAGMAMLSAKIDNGNVLTDPPVRSQGGD